MRRAALLLLGLVACGDGTGPGDEAPNGKIVFSSREADPNGERQQIFAMNPDGSERVQLTNELNEGYTILRSRPGGTRVAYYKVNLTVASGIYTMRGDGSDPTGPFKFDFSIWDITDDGERVVGIKDQTVHQTLAVGDLRTGEATDLPTGDVLPGEAIWSPDGELIAFTGREDDGLRNELYVIRPDGSGLQQITDDESIKYVPSWSPDGRMIAFSREVIGEGLKLYVLELGLNRLRPVYSSECQGGRAPWSPDSREVMCTDGRGQTRAIVNVATGDALELFASGDLYGCTGWSPDGTKLLCADSRGGSRWTRTARIRSSSSRRTAARRGRSGCEATTSRASPAQITPG